MYGIIQYVMVGAHNHDILINMSCLFLLYNHVVMDYTWIRSTSYVAIILVRRRSEQNVSLCTSINVIIPDAMNGVGSS